MMSKSIIQQVSDVLEEAGVRVLANPETLHLLQEIDAALVDENALLRRKRIREWCKALAHPKSRSGVSDC